MAGIPTSNILQPGAITVPGGVTHALISDLQLLTPQFYSKYTEKYGSEEFFMWLATYAGMERVKNREFFWFENRGKLMPGVQAASDVANANTPGATVNVTLAPEFHYTPTTTPLRLGESFRVASTNVEGEIIGVTPTPGAFTFQIRPKRADQALNSLGSTSLLSSDVLLLAGDIDAGEASDSIDPQAHLDERYTNTITEMRESWAATDLAGMTQVWYDSGVSGDVPAGGAQAGVSFFTLKGLKKANERYLNHIEAKLMRGDRVTNTGLGSTTSVGTEGFIPKILQDGEQVGYTPGTLDIAKLHEITRIMDVNGCAKENIWLMDVYQRQNFSDGIFKEFPAGSWIWGENERSQEAAIRYGVQSMYIDEYMLKAKKYKIFNSEVTVGLTPAVDRFRNFGIICPQGESRFARDEDGNNVKNITVMYQDPPKGGTIGNGIRVWQHGGGSLNPTDGKMVDKIEMITYRGLRVAAANQFVVVQAGS